MNYAEARKAILEDQPALRRKAMEEAIAQSEPDGTDEDRAQWLVDNAVKLQNSARRAIRNLSREQVNNEHNSLLDQWHKANKHNNFTKAREIKAELDALQSVYRERKNEHETEQRQAAREQMRAAGQKDNEERARRKEALAERVAKQEAEEKSRRHPEAEKPEYQSLMSHIGAESAAPQRNGFQ